MKVATYLRTCPYVTKLNYVGLQPDASDADAVRDYRIHTSQSAGPGCVMSFTTGSIALSRRFIDALRIFKLTVSFGSVNSLCEMPCYLSHASIPGDQREWSGKGDYLTAAVWVPRTNRCWRTKFVLARPSSFSLLNVHAAGKLPEDLIRLSVGIEDPNDLIYDIQQAFELAGNAHVPNVRAVRRRSVAEEQAKGAAAAAAAAASSAAAAHLEPEISLGCGTATAEDAALIARSEIARLQALVKVLKERIAEGEARSASLEAARRLALGGGGASSGSDGATGGTTNGSGSNNSSSSPLSATSPLHGLDSISGISSSTSSSPDGGISASAGFRPNEGSKATGGSLASSPWAIPSIFAFGTVTIAAVTSAVAVAVVLGRRG